MIPFHVGAGAAQTSNRATTKTSPERPWEKGKSTPNPVEVFKPPLRRSSYSRATVYQTLRDLTFISGVVICSCWVCQRRACKLLKISMFWRLGFGPRQQNPRLDVTSCAKFCSQLPRQHSPFVGMWCLFLLMSGCIQEGQASSELFFVAGVLGMSFSTNFGACNFALRSKM